MEDFLFEKIALMYFYEQKYDQMLELSTYEYFRKYKVVELQEKIFNNLAELYLYINNHAEPKRIVIKRSKMNYPR